MYLCIHMQGKEAVIVNALIFEPFLAHFLSLYCKKFIRSFNSKLQVPFYVLVTRVDVAYVITSRDTAQNSIHMCI